jgi:hypothetical protein
VIDPVIDRHLTAIGATLQLALAQYDALRHALNAPAPEPRGARLSIPDRCNGVESGRCAEQDGEWLSKGTLADPNAEKCKGCGFIRSGLS